MRCGKFRYLAADQPWDPHSHEERLFRMRMCALEVMKHLEAFSPRLIGSVSSGRIREGSDIDLHVFTDEIEEQWQAYLKAGGVNE